MPFFELGPERIAQDDGLPALGVLEHDGPQAAVAALVKGYSSRPDSARLVHGLHAWLAATRTNVWFEYVPTDANVADEPSRRLRLADEEWWPAPHCVSCPAPCRQPPLQRLSATSGWAREAELARVYAR